MRINPFSTFNNPQYVVRLFRVGPAEKPINVLWNNYFTSANFVTQYTTKTQLLLLPVGVVSDAHETLDLLLTGHKFDGLENTGVETDAPTASPYIY